MTTASEPTGGRYGHEGGNVPECTCMDPTTGSHEPGCPYGPPPIAAPQRTKPPFNLAVLPHCDCGADARGGDKHSEACVYKLAFDAAVKATAQLKVNTTLTPAAQETFKNSLAMGDTMEKHFIHGDIPDTVSPDHLIEQVALQFYEAMATTDPRVYLRIHQSLKELWDDYAG